MANARIVNTPSQAIPQNSTTHAQNTITTAENVLDFTLAADTTHVLVQFNGADARVRFDGTNPTATVGFVYKDGASAYWTRQMAIAAKAIQKDATAVVVEIQQLNYL
jgi:hypothetical protein